MKLYSTLLSFTIDILPEKCQISVFQPHLGWLRGDVELYVTVPQKAGGQFPVPCNWTFYTISYVSATTRRSVTDGQRISLARPCVAYMQSHGKKDGASLSLIELVYPSTILRFCTLSEAPCHYHGSLIQSQLSALKFCPDAVLCWTRIWCC